MAKKKQYSKDGKHTLAVHSHLEASRYLLLLFGMLCSLAALAQSPTRKMVTVEPDEHNQKIIARYNRCRKNPNMYPRTPFSKDFTAIFWVAENSMMSNQDVEISIVKERIDNALYDDKEDRVYFVQIKNKTDYPIYIDRGCCFRIDSDSTRYYYYDPHNPVDSIYRERMVTIPPHEQKNLTDYRWIRNPQSNVVEIVEYPEEFLWNMDAVGISWGYLYIDESRLFTEKNSPFSRTFEICYSKEPDFSTYSLAQIICYIKEIIGCYYPENYRYDLLKNHYIIVGDDKYSITSWLPLY